MEILMKTCSKCKETKDLSEFNRQSSNRDGYCTQCRVCRSAKKKAWKRVNQDKVKASKQRHRETDRAITRRWKQRNQDKVLASKAKRRASKLQATPSWSEKELIEKVYLKATVYGAHVDHIVPLKSEVVCGLHVWANLQLLPPTDNISKGNRSWPDSWD
jgi:hypothetical protein